MCEVSVGLQTTLPNLSPEGIKAGVDVLMGSGRVEFDLPDWAARELVQDIFAAVRLALSRVDENQPP